MHPPDGKHEAFKAECLVGGDYCVGVTMGHFV